jgi:predicted amidophosphoribosyltransferase
LEAYGIVTKDGSHQKDALRRPKQCPNCNEPNKPDSRFCAKCRMVLTYDAYSETLESQKHKDDKLSVMEGQLNTMQSQMQAMITAFQNIKDQDQINDFAKYFFESGVLKVPDSNE